MRELDPFGMCFLASSNSFRLFFSLGIRRAIEIGMGGSASGPGVASLTASLAGSLVASFGDSLTASLGDSFGDSFFFS